MEISWLIPRPFIDQHSYILDTYFLISKKLKDIRIDSVNGEKNYYGNKIPSKGIRRVFDFILSNTKYKNTFNYIWLKKNPVDILHVQYSGLFSHIIPLLKIKKRPKIVITLRGSDTYWRPWIDEKWMNLYKIYSNDIDAFVVQSTDQKLYLNKFEVEEKKIWIIPSGSKSIECSPGIIKKGQKIKIISAFRFVWEKNITGNLVFIKMLKEKYPNIEYCIYGGGADLGQIHYLIHRLNISDVVKVKGYIPNKELKRKYLEFNYYLQLSISEASSITVIESQQRGLVPIVSNIGGLKDLVQDGETGIIKDFSDYENLVSDTLKLHQNPEAYNKISKQCIENIKRNYTPDIEAQGLRKMYETIIMNL